MKSNLKLFSMLFGAAVVMLLAGCGETPVDVAKKYHSAVYKDADSAKAVEFCSREYKDTTKGLVKEVQAKKNTVYGDAKIDGDTAKVKVKTKDGDGNVTATVEYQLDKEDGAWKISKINYNPKDEK